MRAGHYTEIETVRHLVSEVGATLRGIRLEDGDEHEKQKPEALSLAIASPAEPPK
jgi:hypothetical protein